MSGYAGEEPHIPYCPTPPDKVRLITFSAARCLLRQASEEPAGGVAAFLEEAANKGTWKVEFERHGTLLPGYDDIVGTMRMNLESDNPVLQSFGRLVANSVPVQLIGDGR
jgi:hypothetical protein